MLKRIEIITGYHNKKEICQGCPFNFSNLVGPQLIYLTKVVYSSEGRGGKISPLYYCGTCAANILNDLGQEVGHSLDPRHGEEFSKRHEEWQRFWKEIEIEKKIDSGN